MSFHRTIWACFLQGTKKGNLVWLFHHFKNLFSNEFAFNKWAGGEGHDRGRDGWVASLTRWTWVWASSGRWWRTWKPDVLQSMGLQSWTWLSNWTELNYWTLLFSQSTYYHLRYIHTFFFFLLFRYLLLSKNNVSSLRAEILFISVYFFLIGT